MLILICALGNCMPVLAQQVGYGFRAGANFPSYSLPDGSSISGTLNFQLGAFLDVLLSEITYRCMSTQSPAK